MAEKGKLRKLESTRQPRQPKQTKQTKQEQLVSSAIQYGVQELLNNNPIFKGYETVLTNYVDNQKLQHKLKEIYDSPDLKGKKEFSKEDEKYIATEIADYFVTGAALSEKGQEVILGRGLEGKVSKSIWESWFGISKKKHSLPGIEYLNDAIRATEDLSALLKDKGGIKALPNLAKPLAKLEEIKLLYPALRVLRANKLIDQSKYQELANKAYEIAKDIPKQIAQGVEEGINRNYQKIAAAILGVLGVLVIASNLSITGNIIANVSKTAPNFMGVLLIIIALGLFLFKIKKTGKNKSKKKL